jgi:hypothetical protein
LYVRQEGVFDDTKTGSRSAGKTGTSSSSRKGGKHNAKQTNSAVAAAAAAGGVECDAGGCWLLARAKLVHPNFSQVR